MLSIVIANYDFVLRWRIDYVKKGLVPWKIHDGKGAPEDAANTGAAHATTSCSCCTSLGVRFSFSAFSSFLHSSEFFERSCLGRLLIV